MTDQAARRRLVEEAAVAHSARTRRRLLIGSAAAILLAAAGAAAFVILGGNELDRAVERAREGTARVRFDVSGGGDSGASFSGEMVTAGDGSKATGEGTLTVGGDSRPTVMRVLGDRVWVRDGDRWLSLSPEEAPWAPAHLIGLLADTRRVRATGRESAAGRRTTHYTAELPLSAVTDEDVDGSLPIDAWIDDAGLPALMRSESSDARGDFHLELEVLEWGVPVEVETPPTQ